MTIVDKIQYSSNKTQFSLYKEGLFYKCYNQDAMVFSKRVKNYKVNSKFIKSLGAAVFSLGFPASELAKGHLSLAFISEKIEANNSEIIDGNIFLPLMILVYRTIIKHGWRFRTERQPSLKDYCILKLQPIF
jgi:hypothetical protein